MPKALNSEPPLQVWKEHLGQEGTELKMPVCLHKLPTQTNGSATFKSPLLVNTSPRTPSPPLPGRDAQEIYLEAHFRFFGIRTWPACLHPSETRRDFPDQLHLKNGEMERWSGLKSQTILRNGPQPEWAQHRGRWWEPTAQSCACAENERSFQAPLGTCMDAGVPEHTDKARTHGLRKYTNKKKSTLGSLKQEHLPKHLEPPKPSLILTDTSLKPSFVHLHGLLGSNHVKLFALPKPAARSLQGHTDLPNWHNPKW